MKRFRAVFIIAVLLLHMLSHEGVYVKAENNHWMYRGIIKETTKQDTEKTETNKIANLEITSNAAVLMEGSTGEIIYEKNKDEQLRPASITKIMTLLLIFEAIEEGKIQLTDEVSVSEHAASMGGSQVFLEPFETQTVDTMIKCISICSANDACVAMSEFVAGSEEEFVVKMNERAKELGMKNTQFVNCCGLDVDGHYSSAYDIALMSKELIMNHPQISNYCTVWMDTIIHTTRKGRSEFGLSNTNKLIKTYNGITGLKTGSTGLAKYCLSATAKRNGMNLISVVLAAPETKVRFREAAKLLDYGFANCQMYTDTYEDLVMEPIPVKKGVEKVVTYQPEKEFSYVCTKGKSMDHITKEVVIEPEVEAPIMERDKVGEISYFYNGEKIGSVNLVSNLSIEKAKYKNYLEKTLKEFFMK